MSFTYEMNKLMLIDGILFVLPGINMLLFPSPQRRLKTKLDSKTVVPLFKDVRTTTGASFVSMGITMVALSGIVNNTTELNNFAIFRCISLIFIIYAMGIQVLHKKWKIKGDFIMLFVFYIILMLTYGFLGFIDPLPIQN